MKHNYNVIQLDDWINSIYSKRLCFVYGGSLTVILREIFRYNFIYFIKAHTLLEEKIQALENAIENYKKLAFLE